MNTCYIFGSVDIIVPNVQINSSDLVIAADKGLLTLQDASITPDLIIGDFDSLGYVPQGENIIKHPVKKDDTDLLLAIKKGFEKGFKHFEIYGCLGGDRLDHTIATIQAASFIDENGGTAIIHSDTQCLQLLNNNIIIFDESYKGYVSVFAYTESAVVSIKGLSYNVNKAKISQGFPLGVSNEFIGKRASISCHSGKVLVTWSNKNNNQSGEISNEQQYLN